MDDKIPIPTDNIFKFYALFGLLLFIFSASALIYVVHSANELGYQWMIESATIKLTPHPSPEDQAKMQVLEKRLEIMNSDKKFFVNCIGIIFSGSLVLMVYGFVKWHKDVQPIEDEIARLQLEKLRHEIRQITHQISSKHK